MKSRKVERSASAHVDEVRQTEEPATAPISQQAAVAMHENQTLFQALFEAAPDAKVIVNNKGQIVGVNAQTERMFGYHRNELNGQPVEMLLPEQFRHQHVVHRSGYSVEPQIRPMGVGLELYGRRKDGSTFPVDVMLSPIQLGESSLTISAIRDTTERKEAEAQIQRLNAELEQRVAERTLELEKANRDLKAEIFERKQAEAKLEENRHRLQSLFDHSLDAIFLADNSGHYTDVNRAACLLTGYDQEELLKLNVGRLTATDQNFQAIWQDFLAAGEQKGEYRLRRKDGTIVEVEYRAVANIVPGLHLSLIRDITERKQAERALETQQRFLRQIIDINPNFIFAKDRSGRFTLVNQAVAEAYGTTVEALLGKTDADFNPHPSEVEHFHQDDLEVITTQQEKFIPEEVLNDAQGRVRWLQTVKRPIVGLDGVADQVLGVATDITARKQAEQRLETSLRETEQLLEEKEVLLKEVHHRVKNNLQAVSNLLYLQSTHIQDKQVQEIFSETRNRIKSIALIYEKLHQTETVTQINFAEYVSSLVEQLISSYMIDREAIRLSVHTDAATLGIDTAVPLGIIINELVSNSFKYAFPPGSLELNSQINEIRIELRPEVENRLVLTVSDNGIGLPEAVDLTRTPTLGLSLVQSLVGHMQGTLEVNRDGGTTFTINFLPWEASE